MVEEAGKQFVISGTRLVTSAVMTIVVTAAATATSVMFVVSTQNARLDGLQTQLGTMDNRINSNQVLLMQELTTIREKADSANNLASANLRGLDSLNNNVALVRDDLSNAVTALSNSIARIDPAAAEPLSTWGRVYEARLASEGDDVLEVEDDMVPFSNLRWGVSLGNYGSFDQAMNSIGSIYNTYLTTSLGLPLEPPKYNITPSPSLRGYTVNYLDIELEEASTICGFLLQKDVPCEIFRWYK